jgi:hypothetical protein
MSSSSQTTNPFLNETTFGRSPSPVTVSSFGESTLETPSSGRKACFDSVSSSFTNMNPGRGYPQIEIESGVWVFDSTILDINELHKQCVEKDWISASDSVFAIVNEELITLEPFDKPRSCEIEGCGCEEGANTAMSESDGEGESANDADNEASES